MKTIVQGNAELAKDYKYFACEKCGWIGKANSDEYEYHCDQYQGDWCRVKCPTCRNYVYAIEDEKKLARVMSMERTNAKGYF